MTQIDYFQLIPSLIVALFAIGFTAVWRYDRRRVSARWFAISYASGAVALFIDYFYVALTWMGSALAAGFVTNVPYTITMCAFGMGMLLRYGGVASGRTLLIVPAIVLGGYAALFVVGGTPERTVWMNVMATLVFGWPVVARWGHARTRLDRLLFVLVGITAVQYTLRTVIVLPLEAEPLSATSYSVSLAATTMRFSSAIASLCVATTLLVAFTADIVTDLVRASERDPLTGLLNRRGLDATLPDGGSGSALIAADIDRFKRVNDTHGHAAGDAVLCAFARTLGEAAGPTGAVARLGGEEFVVVIPRATAATARLCAEGARTAFAAICHDEIGGERVTASFGVSERHADEPFADALGRADAALYEAKRAGRDRTAVAAAPERAVAAA